MLKRRGARKDPCLVPFEASKPAPFASGEGKAAIVNHLYAGADHVSVR